MEDNEKREVDANKQNEEEAAKPRKISETILDFVEPITAAYNDANTHQQIAIFGIMVWNASFLKESERTKAKEEILRKLNQNNKEIEDKFSKTIDFLLKRKDEEFNDDKRFIYDYDIDVDKDNNKIKLSVCGRELIDGTL